MTFNELIKKAISQEPYNSTNGWGFGGWEGTIYSFENGATIHHGKRYYRHQRPSGHLKYYSAAGYEISKDEFIGALNEYKNQENADR